MPSHDESSRTGSRHRRLGLTLAVAATVIAIDQLTKWWAVNTLSTRSIDVVWTLRLTLTRNTSTAFSLVDGRGPIIGLLAIVVVGFLVWQGRSSSSRLGSVAIGLVLGGAIGNLIDRAFRGDVGFLQGGVIDFIEAFRWFPVFNVADSSITIGGLLLVAVYAFAPAGDGTGEPDGDAIGTGDPGSGTRDG